MLFYFRFRGTADMAGPVAALIPAENDPSATSQYREIACNFYPLTSFQISAKMVSHGCCVAFQMAEVSIPRNLFANILHFIAENVRTHHRCQRETLDPANRMLTNFG
jgi:hypothetical protein